MEVTKMRERIRSIGSAARAKARDVQLDRAATEQARLRVENEALRDRLEESAHERGRWMSIMERLADSMPEIADDHEERPSKHRLRRLLVLSGAAGSAYVLGAKAGRERYEQIRAWWRGLRSQPTTDQEMTPTTS